MHRENEIRCHSVLDTESSTSVVSQRQQRPSWKMLNQVQHDVLFYNAGFTLIELLVVVLIIGILAAVALPQYQKAVWRSRNVQLKTSIQSVRAAQDAYHIANGKYASDFDEMDIDLPLASVATDNICGMVVSSTNAVRRGTDFEIILHGTGNIIGLWTTGPYTCSGFAWSYNGGNIWQCWEDKSRLSKGDFCTKIEKMSSGSDSGYGQYIFSE